MVGAAVHGGRELAALERTVGYLVNTVALRIDLQGEPTVDEAGRGALEVARLLGHQRIEAGHFVDNPASGRVLRKIGFLPTGRVAPRASRARGGEAPCKLFSLHLRADARARPQAA